jgi:primosomal protein N' (replication factor Y)
MTKKSSFTKHRFLSNQLLAQITEAMAAGHQVLLFHNRRGSAPMTLCEQCGWSAACPRCFVPLTLHSDHFELRCHICNHTERVPTSCPSCGNASVIHKGIGTKLVAEELTRLFPKANIMRFDGDSLEGETLERSYQALYDGEIDIIIGTQVVAKGLDLPHLRVVGVIQADSGLSLPDFSSSERVFQLLAQVSGRVGRNEHDSHVIVQSYQPEHPSVVLGIRQDYESFYEYCLAERKRSLFPPFTYLLKLTCVYKTEGAAIRAAAELARTLRRVAPAGVTILGPAPAFYERVRDTYRWQLTVKSPSRPDLITLLTHLPRDRWQYELDPSSLL